MEHRTRALRLIYRLLIKDLYNLVKHGDDDRIKSIAERRKTKRKIALPKAGASGSLFLSQTIRFRLEIFRYLKYRKSLGYSNVGDVVDSSVGGSARESQPAATGPPAAGRAKLNLSFSPIIHNGDTRRARAHGAIFFFFSSRSRGSLCRR